MHAGELDARKEGVRPLQQRTTIVPVLRVLGGQTTKWRPPTPLVITNAPRVLTAYQVLVGTFKAQLANLGSILSQSPFLQTGKLSRARGCIAKKEWGFPGGPVVKNPPSNAGDTGSILGQGTKDPTCCGATEPSRHN